MAKHYTQQEPTPVFAVTFVSNRKGIVPDSYVIPTEEVIQIQKEIEELEKRKKDSGGFFKDVVAQSNYSGIGEAVIQEQINEKKANIIKINDRTSKVKDNEYLVYSNIEIQPTSDTDLSKQSNWFLRDAEVEVTRDWPISKAKLVIACKLNDDGTIPTLKEVERGFTYQQTPKEGDKTGKQVDFIPLARGRFLGVDDEIRIYAGYKSNTCVSMEDLDQYPFSFTHRVSKGPLSTEDGTRLDNLDSLNKEVAKIKDINVEASIISQEKNTADINKVLGQINGSFLQKPLGGFLSLAPFSIEYKLDNKTTIKAVTNNQEYKELINGIENQINLLISKYQDLTLEPKEETANKPLAPIFWGFIDSVDFIGNSNGVQIIYNLRDRSRILADTKIITIPFLTAGKGEKGAFEGLRHKTIEGVYRASNGGLYLDNSFTNASSFQWRENFKPGSIITLWDNSYKDSTNTSKGRVADQVKRIQENATASSEERIKFNAAFEDPAKWVIANSFLPNPETPYDPLFHIWTLQPPLVSGSGPTSIQIINKSPFEILSYLSTTEVMPIDFFCSHVNGHFMFAPRILDTTGLNDPDRGNRLYFFFDCFDKVPESRSVIKDIRVSTSTIGIYNRFTVSSADFNNPTNSSLKDIVSVIDVASANTKNKKIPIKQHIIVDPKIKDAGKELVGTSTIAAAQALALTTASTMARDNITVIMKIIGDSSFYPGEAIRVYNTVLHSNGILTFKNKEASQSVFLKTLYEETEKIKQKGKQIKQGGKEEKIVSLDTALATIRNASGEETSQLNNVLPMYKVRAITHSLKAGGTDAGYTTKIVAIGDIL